MTKDQTPRLPATICLPAVLYLPALQRRSCGIHPAESVTSQTLRSRLSDPRLPQLLRHRLQVLVTAAGEVYQDDLVRTQLRR